MAPSSMRLVPSVIGTIFLLSLMLFEDIVQLGKGVRKTAKIRDSNLLSAISVSIIYMTDSSPAKHENLTPIKGYATCGDLLRLDLL